MASQESVDKLAAQVQALVKSVTDSETAVLGAINQQVNILQDIQSLQASVTSIQSSIAHNSSTTAGPSTRQNPTAPLDSNLGSFPVYNCNFMTPEGFLAVVEENLTWRNVQPDKWLLLVPRLFPSDSDHQKWFYAIKSTLTDWTGFKNQFLAYEKGDSNKDSLYEQLFASRQKYEDAFESYAWDIFTLYRKIDPSIDQA